MQWASLSNDKTGFDYSVKKLSGDLETTKRNKYEHVYLNLFYSTLHLWLESLSLKSLCAACVGSAKILVTFDQQKQWIEEKDLYLCFV